jgi:hypothetical protein
MLIFAKSFIEDHKTINLDFIVKGYLFFLTYFFID